MMLMARSEELWLPGKVPANSEAISRVEQISRSREELMRLLADLPEPEHELSFTDLVELVPPVAEGTRSCKIGSLEEEKEAKETAKNIVKAARRDSKKVRRSSSGCTSGGDDRVRRGGVLLNVYVPPLLLGRSLTMSRLRRSSSSSSLEGTHSSSKSEKGSPVGMESGNTCCWPSIWTKGKAKSRKQ